IGYEQRRLGGRYWQPNPGELAWHDGQVGVGESRSRVQRATAAVDLVVQKVQFAGAAPSLLTMQTDLNGGLCLRGLADARMSVRTEPEAHRLQSAPGSGERCGRLAYLPTPMRQRLSHAARSPVATGSHMDAGR